MGKGDGNTHRRGSLRPRKSCAGCCTRDGRVLQQVELGNRTVWLCMNCQHIIETDITTPTTILSLKAAINGTTRITPWPKQKRRRKGDPSRYRFPESDQPFQPVR